MRWTQKTLAPGLALCLAGCLAASDVDESRSSLTDGTAEAVGVLALLNAPATSFELLDVDVGLDRRAARNLITRRNGADGAFGTADDQLFHTIAAVDAVAYVGPSALDKLVAYSRANGYVPAGDDLLGVFDGVPFTFDQAAAALDLCNTASEAVLRDDVDLDTRAVNSITAARPIASVAELAELYYVGPAMLTRIRDFAAPVQIGIISDLDKTVIPPHEDTLPDAAYAGVATLYNAIDRGGDSDVYYVTARTEDRITEIPAWLEAHGIPRGLIHTGISPYPWIAREEKVRDILSVLDAHPEQKFVFFGDTKHVDPDAFRDVIAQRPDQVIAAFVHRIYNIDPARLEGLILFEDHRTVATELHNRGVIDAATAAAIRDEVAAAPEDLR